MILLGRFLQGLGTVLGMVVHLYIFLLIAYAVLSWVSPDPRNPIVQFIRNATDPVIEPVKRRVPPLGMFDVSVILVILALYFVNIFLVSSILDYGELFLRQGKMAGAL